MTKGRAVLPGRVVAGQKPFFISLGGPQAHDFSSRDDNSFFPQGLQRETLAPVMICHPDRSEAQWRDLRFFLSIAQQAHQVQVAFCLADIAHDLRLQELWRGPAPLLAKAAVKEQPQRCLVFKRHGTKIEEV
jgi:hypothetical protein